MRPKRRTTSDVPADLAVYDEARWVRHALDVEDGFVRNMRPTAELLANGREPVDVLRRKYLGLVIAPAHYRDALRAAVGERAGDEWFATRFRGTTTAGRLVPNENAPPVDVRGP